MKRVRCAEQRRGYPDFRRTAQTCSGKNALQMQREMMPLYGNSCRALLKKAWSGAICARALRRSPELSVESWEDCFSSSPGRMAG